MNIAINWCVIIAAIDEILYCYFLRVRSFVPQSINVSPFLLVVFI